MIASLSEPKGAQKVPGLIERGAGAGTTIRTRPALEIYAPTFRG
jgi:hypothetical protein